MEREIKFRAWSKFNHKMESWIVLKEEFFYNFEDDNYIFMQFTGFKDKNGKDIYEGDILKIPIGDGGYAPVTFEDGKFIAYNQYDFLREFEQEVIGNIHQNPELLK